jgi:hypothetical protein
MAIKLELDTYLAEKILRSDIVMNLGYEGISAIIDWYNDFDEDVEFDPSLFWVWTRYESALAAVTDHDSSVVEEIVEDLKADLDEGEKVDQDDVEMECKQWLMDNTRIIVLDSGEILVDGEF